ncbi:MAG: PspC domain-containing protein [Brevibacillus sp.]|nr:PspC domain-containing protein [Brevibacillus sp.]
MGMNRLYRSRDDKKLFGLCGGFARYVGIDSTWVRLGFILLVMFTGVPILFYLLAVLIVPKEPHWMSKDDPLHSEWARWAVDDLDQEIDRLEKRALKQEVYRLRRELAKYQTL